MGDTQARISTEEFELKGNGGLEFNNIPEQVMVFSQSCVLYYKVDFFQLFSTVILSGDTELM